MSEVRWLTRKEAAERVGKTERTIRNWEDAKLLKPIIGRYREDELLRADRQMRGRVGRPRKTS